MDKDTKGTLEQIRADIKHNNSPNESLGSEDDNLIASANSENDDTEYKVRNVLYSNILYEFIEEHKSKSKSKRCYKFVFFVVTMVIFLALVAAPIIIMFIVVTKEGEPNSDLIGGVASIIGSAIGIVTAVIVLPKIIAEHLFPTNEETYLIELIKNMQSNDLMNRESSRLER